MKAIVHEKYGPPSEVLSLREVDVPSAARGEVLVRVHAASIHPDVWHVVTGRPYVLRLMGAGRAAPRCQVPGTDVAGRVESVGDGVAELRPGDDVFGEVVRGHQWMNGGTFAEYVAVPASALLVKPANLTFVEAAAVPTSGLIALRALREEGGLKAGQRVLINGAGGGVGGFALQIAKAFGAEVTAVDHAEKLDLLGSLGADHVVDYEREDFTRGQERYDLILDVASTLKLAAAERVLTREGKFVLIGHDHYDARRRWLGSLPRMLGLTLRALFDHHLPMSFATEAKDGLSVLKELIEKDQLRPAIDRTYPLSEVREALRYLTEGRPRGKIVVTV